ncbi:MULTISPECIES: hypothetical protein [Bacillus]|uniref:Uncharacterized protein n=1 Tax=Bacillus glycinifermentans TaxID=1664069 RepID=A0A0T6BPE8_9BACI|nr:MULTISPECIES: hypothetical protein [Bacillus]MBS4162350.1 hypothetical protein [Klebsiella pneumoniae]KRT93062.1 hypothetical protein AB447_203780 [Bacillus glycinifermentans]MEC0341957.1 hypothetical protein [Bacillus sonorensis]MEC0457529.1 hypothetical protein [Bacillus sonorensis]MEC0487873.1 hypothetical protein [Bacillus glycinifermentans]
MNKQIFLDFRKRELTKEEVETLNDELSDYFQQREKRIYASKRKKLLEQASKISFVPGHEPNLDQMDNERLENLIKLTETTSK